MAFKLPSVEADALSLWLGLIPEQRQEIEASHGVDGLSTIVQSIAVSQDCYSFFSSNELLGITGLVPLSVLGGRASPWLLTTEAVLSHPKVLLKHTKQLIKEWMQDWDVLENYVDARYHKAVRWAQWAGFTIYPAEPYGVAGQLFHRIEIRR